MVETSRDFTIALNRFEQAWMDGPPPEIGSFLEGIQNPQQRQRLCIELVSLEIEFRWRRAAESGDAAGTPPLHVETYLQQYPELGSVPDAPVDLISEEYRARHRWGDRPGHEEYRRRFPEHAAEIARTLDRVDEQILAEAGGIASDAQPDPRFSPTVEQTLEPDAKSGLIGPYKILQPIGEGGMGSVFMAEQSKPVKRRVALKVIKADVPSKAVLARFEAERQALAMMDHQNIAKVLDAGVTEDGHPYFAMELVKGIPITAYCDQNKLSPSERLALFVQVCRAIQHAHQKGIIHRDIKPSNVLVTLYDGKPVAKVIDFGLAKALQSQLQLTEHTMFTQFGQVVGTLEYMSPEQAEMNTLDVDTRTDVYSLGVMLYELLTGSTPIGRERLKSQAFDRILQLIREEEAPRPSTRLSESGAAIKGISDQRRTDPKRLNLLLKGDLDWITVKALEKDRTRRYDGAAALADDVERFLQDEPIVARPPSWSYRAQKAVRKHKAAFATATLVVSLLVAGLAGTGAMWLRATRARSDALAETARATRAETDALKEARNARQAEAAMQVAKAEAEQERDRAQQAEAQASKGREQAQANAMLAAQQTQTVLTTLEDLIRDFSKRSLTPSEEKQLLGSTDGKITVFRDASGASAHGPGSWPREIDLATWDRQKADKNRLVTMCLTGLDDVTETLLGQARPDGSMNEQLDAMGDRVLRIAGLLTPLEREPFLLIAERLFSKSRDIWIGLAETASADRPTLEQLADAHAKLASVYLVDQQPTDEQLKKAVVYLDRELEVRSTLAEKYPNEADPQLALVQYHTKVGDLLWQTGDKEGALDHDRTQLKIRKRLADSSPDHPERLRELIQAHASISQRLRDADNAVEALQHDIQTIDLRQRLATADPSNVAIQQELIANHDRVASYLQQTGEQDQALAHFSAALPMRQALAESDPDNIQLQQDLASGHQTLGDALQQATQNEKALEHYTAGLEILQALAEADPDSLALQQQVFTSIRHLGDKRPEQTTTALAFDKTEIGFLRQLARLGLDSQKQLEQAFDASNTAVVEEYNKQHLAEQVRPHLSSALNQLAWLAHQEEFKKPVLAYLDSELQMVQELAGQNPDDRLAQVDLVDMCYALGEAFDHAQRRHKAIPYLRKALEIRRKLADAHPDELAARASVADALRKLGDLCRFSQREQEKRAAYYQEEVAIRRELVDAQADDTNAQSELAYALTNYGEQLLASSPEEALGHFQQALTIIQQRADSEGGWYRTYRLPYAYKHIGNALQAGDRWPEAIQSYQKCLEVCQQALKELNADTYSHSSDYESIASLLDEITNACIKAGDESETQRFWDASTKIIEKLVEVDKDGYERRLAQRTESMADSYLAAGKVERAEEYLRSAFILYEESANAEPEANYSANYGPTEDLIQFCWRTANFESQLQRFDEARRWCQKGLKYKHPRRGILFFVLMKAELALAGDWRKTLNDYQEEIGIHEFEIYQAVSHGLLSLSKYPELEEFLEYWTQQSRGERESLEIATSYANLFSDLKPTNPDPDETYEYARKSIEFYRAGWHALQGASAFSEVNAGPIRLLLDEKSCSMAEPLFREVLRDWPQRFPNKLPAGPKLMLALSLSGQNKFEEAEPMILDAYRIVLESSTAEGKTDSERGSNQVHRVAPVMRHLITFYQAWDKSDEVEKWRGEAEKQFLAWYDEGGGYQSHFAGLLVELYKDWGKPELAEAWAKR